MEPKSTVQCNFPIFLFFLSVYFAGNRIHYCMAHRASKVKALHQMSSMLPTPLTERMQQKVETDWTPSPTGYHILRECHSIFTPLQTDQALLKINESLQALEKRSHEGRTSPITSLMETTWAKVSREEQTYFVKKATEACKIVCSAIATGDGEKLFHAVCKPDDPNEENELQPLLEAHRDAPSKETKTQILSIYANKYPAKELIELHKMYEPITEWELRKAKLHANEKGPGVPVEKPVYHRVRLDTVKVNHFLEFINRPYFYQDVAYGTRTIKVSNGEKLVMPNVIRTVTRSTIIAQYLQLCQEESFEPLSQATVYRILEVREASQRKALRGLDNVAAEGTAAFETLERVLEELQKASANTEWSVKIKERLNQGKRYLKTDYKVHCKEDSSPCADHCRVFALSDESDNAFKQECEHPQNLQCDLCEDLKSVLEEIEICLKNESQSISFYSKEHQEDIVYDFLQAKKYIFDWKAHILRSENQYVAKQDVLRSLDATSALITMDWVMKFQCQKYREKQSEWFGKRGLSWHVSSVVLKQTEEPMVLTYTHMFDSFTQDWFAVASILENLLLTLKTENPSLSKAYIRSDEAGCYHNNFLIASIHDISQRTGVAVERYDFSEPQHGKDICDRIICPMKQSVRRYCDEGHDIQSAADMREALHERPVQGVTASVCEVNDKQKSIDVTKIPNFSAYHNFEFDPQGIRLRKAHSVGQGKTVNYTNIVRTPQGATSIIVKNKQNFFDMSVARSLKSKQSTQSKASPLFVCPQEGCASSFQSFDSLQHHLNYGQHENKTSQESVYDQLRRDWVARFSTVLPENRPRPKLLISSTTSFSLPIGWALQKPRTGGTRYSSQVKDYLKARFDAGEESGCKADPGQVSLDMRNARTENNKRLFSRGEWLTRSQIQAHFSRLSVLKRKQGSTQTSPHITLDEVDDVIEEEDWLQQVCEVYDKLSVQHPIYYDAYNLCDLYQKQKLGSFNVEVNLYPF